MQRFVRYLSLLLLCSLSACSTAMLSTSGSDEVQRAHFAAGNLFPDPGFEGDVLSNWSGNGCGVSTDVTNSGKASLQLQSSGEKPVNCLSPAVSVSPGHYDFTLWFKAAGFDLTDDILYRDLVQITVHLFDEYGREIDQQVQFRNRTLDAADLGSAFGRALLSEEVPLQRFSQIALRPHYYRYDWGWLPENVHTARLEITLGGRGKLWIDDISLQFSKWNFTLKERIELLGLKKGEQFLYPAPAEIERSGERFELTGSTVCVDSIQDPELYTGLVWRRFLQKLDGLSIPFSERCLENDNLYRLIFSSKNKSSGVALNKEGYRLKTGPQKALIQAGTPHGFRRALHTLRQLIAGSSQSSYITGAVVLDQPYFSLRSVSAKDVRRDYPHAQDSLQWLDENGLNTIFIELNTVNGAWWEEDLAALALAARLGESSDHVQFGVLINPYIHNADDEVTRELVLSDPDTVEDLVNVITPYLKHGAKKVILRSDDFVPARKDIARFAYYLDHPGDRAVYENLAQAHADLIRRLQVRLKAVAPGVELIFVPPFYSNFFVDESAGFGVAYLKSLSDLMPEDVALMWAGQSVRSLIIDEFQAARFSGLLQGHPVILWDNTLYARRHAVFWGQRPERAQLCSLFEPYSVELPPEYLQAGGFLNVGASALQRIQLATAGAYLWNPNKYHPEKTLHAYLIDRFGWEGAEMLLALDEAYWALRSARLGARERRVRYLKLKLGRLLRLFENSTGSQDSKLLRELKYRVQKVVRE